MYFKKGRKGGMIGRIAFQIFSTFHRTRSRQKHLQKTAQNMILHFTEYYFLAVYFIKYLL